MTTALTLTAWSASFSGHLDPLHEQVGVALEAEAGTWTARQRRGLRRADKQLGRSSTSLTRDLATLRRVNGPLGKIAKVSTSIESALGTAFSDLRGELDVARSSLAARLARWPDSSVVTKARKRLAAADAALAVADRTTKRGKRARLLAKANRKLLEAHARLDRSGIGDPPAGPPGARSFKSGPIQITADGRFVWVVNSDHDTVSRIATGTDRVDEFALPPAATRHDPRGLALLEDGSEVFVACHGTDRVLVLDGETGAVTRTIELPWGSGAHGIAIAPDQETALVSLFRTTKIAVVDLSSHAVTDVLTGVYHGPLGIAWTEDGQSAWIAHPFADGEHSRITEVRRHADGFRVEARIALFATDPRQQSRLAEPYDLAEGGYLTIRAHLAQIPSTSGRNEMWLPTQYNNINNDEYTPDSTIQTTIRRLRLSDRAIPNTNADKVILSAVHVHDASAGNKYVGPGWNARVSGPVDIAFSADGATVLIVCEQSDDVLIVPTNTPAVRPATAAFLTEIAVGDRPQGVALGRNGIAYVSNRYSRDVSVVDLGARRELRRLPVTPDTDEPFTSAFLTGARLFHKSDDPRISSTGKVGCASCHVDAEHDGRMWGFHNLPGRHGNRVTTTMRGLGRTFGQRDTNSGLGQLHLSGDRDEVQDFEHTFRGPNMGGTGFLGGDVQPELGSPNAGRDDDLDALATYLLELPAIERSPHRAPDGALTEAATRGATMFVGADAPSRAADAGCATCHVPESGFVDFRFHDVGSHRFGQEEELNHPVRGNFRWKVNTSTLVGVWATPPYSGSSGHPHTIGALLTAMRDDGTHGTLAGLTDRQLEDLAEFVRSIDGDLTATDVRSARDTEPPRIVAARAWALTKIDVFFNETVVRDSAEDVANWTVLDDLGNALPVTAARLDPARGDRVTLTASLAAGTDTEPRRYTVVPGGIRDAAATVTGGVANELDVTDSGNRPVVEVGETLTVTLGASGRESVTVVVHDSAMAGSGLSNWNHDHVTLFPTGGSRQNKGFVRFEWRDAFSAATGVVSADRILDAAVELTPLIGMAGVIEARRCLQPWRDSAIDKDWNTSANGSPTWLAHEHPDGRWNQNGAEKRTPGVDGDDPAHYGGANDSAHGTDAVATMPSITQPVTISGDGMRDAYRFWFENPAVDYGHVLQLPEGGNQHAAFKRTEREEGAHGPVLTITYRVTD